MAISTQCPRYADPRENILHALRDCNTSKATWLQVKPDLIDREFFNIDLQQWVKINMSNAEVFDDILWGLYSYMLYGQYGIGEICVYLKTLAGRRMLGDKSG